MAGKRARKGAASALPREIPMTDLEYAGEITPDPREEDADVHAAGTPGGGTAHGGLAGTNFGDGSPDDVDLESAMGSGIHDNGGEEEAEEEQGGFAGPSGGAVGGTPANRRARGGRTHGGTNPGGERPGDSTIGS
jgi:hypothetical protein